MDGFSVMAGAREITEATKILFGNNRKTLYVQRDLPTNRRNQLLLGMLRGHRPAFGVSNKRTVSLRFRAQSKPRDFAEAVTSSVDEQSSLIEKPSWISIQKLGALRWLQKETYETENLGTGSFLEKKMKGGVDCGLTEATRLGRSRRYLLSSKGVLQNYQINEFAAIWFIVG
ncbi:phosphoribosylformylglycinamidine synthase [Salix suchowensis]|nr:phosphoribosylformylglycinamidine synthase [Salix suchowensis]